jgi:hypothetical protein
MEHSSNTYPYGLVNAASEYMAHIPHLFVDPAERNHVLDLYLLDLPKPNHPASIVNVVEIRQIEEDSLSTIPEECTRSTEPHGINYTRTLNDPYGEDCNTSGVKHALGITNHEHEHHIAFIITCYINETVV